MRALVKSTFVFFAVSVFVSLSALSACAADSKNDKLAQCLTQKSAKMYGTFWCSHCKDQKDMFGESFKYVTYVECAIPGTRKETEACKQMKIEHTPTWIFKDGTRREGALPLTELGQIAGCSVK